MIWMLLIAFILHLFFLFFVISSSETPNIEQRFLQATQVLLYDLEEEKAEEEPEVLEEKSEEKPAIEAKAEIKPVETKPVETKKPAPEQAVEAESAIETEKPTHRSGLSKSLLTRSLEIARLEAELAAMQTSYAQQPRVRRISSGAQMTSEEALYLRQWEKKVERIGNLNYPEEARSQNLGGRLRLMVVIAADGRILEAQLLTSSGHSLLDNAAIRILNLAAPFAPLPESIKAQAEVLEIIRTWQFGDGWYAN